MRIERQKRLCCLEESMWLLPFENRLKRAIHFEKSFYVPYIVNSSNDLRSDTYRQLRLFKNLLIDDFSLID